MIFLTVRSEILRAPFASAAGSEKELDQKQAEGNPFLLFLAGVTLSKKLDFLGLCFLHGQMGVILRERAVEFCLHGLT